MGLHMTEPKKRPGRDLKPNQNGYRDGLLGRLLLAYDYREIARALRMHGHHRTNSCDFLGISRRTLINHMKDAGMNTRGTINAFAAETDLQLQARIFKTPATVALAEQEKAEQRLLAGLKIQNLAQESKAETSALLADFRMAAES